jgi:hypothetical protein
MYDLFLVGLLLAGQHVAITYAAIEIWRLDYRTYLMMTMGISLAVALLIKVFVVGWKDRIEQVMRGELEDRELFPDLGLFLLTLVASSVVTAYLVYKRYGIAGWLGATALNYAIGWAI